MFKNVGKELKNWARIIVILMTVPSVLVSILLIVIFAEQDLTFLGIVFGVIVIALGYFFARLSAIMLYAYGELVDRTESIDDRLEMVGKSHTEEIPSVQTGSGWNPNAFSSYK
ncbi:MAG: hypothetical protein J6B95_02755 [Oscillospiraceae bacterium]|nr:hypothetical protein [Oscillospiraceae bacterium]